MALGDGVRRNIAHVRPAERALLRDALVELNNRVYPGIRTDPVPGGVTWWFKQDEIHAATHVHGGPEFVPWHRVMVNRFEALLREINPQLSLHYWDWTQDPRAIPGANMGGAATGTLNLFTPTKEYESSWIFEPRLTCVNALRRVQHPGFSLVTSWGTAGVSLRRSVNHG
jgi:Common central domain of tyrosinase